LRNKAGGTRPRVHAVRRLTDLLEVSRGVTIAQADQAIAQAELEAGTRKLVRGVAQRGWAPLAARRLQQRRPWRTVRQPNARLVGTLSVR
jgi:hypothetical protein